MACRPHAKNEPDRETRMSSCGEVELVGDLAPLIELRNRWLAAKQEMVDLVWVDDPLLDKMSKAAVSGLIRGWQKSQSGFNKAYLQLAGDQVADEVSACHVAYFKRLSGCVRFCGMANPPVKDKHREWLERTRPERARPWRYVPVGLEPSEGDFAAIRALVADDAPEGVISALCRIVRGEKTLGEVADAIIREIHRMALARFGKPDYCKPLGPKGIDDRVVQIHLDYRVVAAPATRVVRDVLDGLVATALHVGTDGKRRPASVVVDISNPIPGGPSIPIPVRLAPDVAERFADGDARALAIGIGADRLSVGMSRAKPVVQVEEMPQVRRVVARDFGIVNTVSLAVIEFPDVLDEAVVEAAAGFGKAEAREWLSTRQAPEGMRVLRVERHEGRNFLAAIAAHDDKIGMLSTHIDGVFAKIHAIKLCLNGWLGRDLDAFIDEEAVPEDAFVRHLHAKFFRLWREARRLVAQRRTVYDAIAGMKRSWFGFLANRELRLLREFDAAAVVREDLSYVAGTKGAADWLGSRMAKAINAASRGIHAKAASANLAWAGIRELVVPSYYTSSTCVVDGLMIPEARKGEVFDCPICGKSHADENAAITIGAWLWLRPKTSNLPVKNAEEGADHRKNPSPSEAPHEAAVAA